ncbi:MAG: hypothetical protein H0V12_06980 [Chloroflexi bacterium]|nr:hypothetical protein [Chloroflexota bacterium]
MATYRNLARRFPDTDAGRVGERRSQPSALLGWNTILDNGPPENRVVIAVLGEGFTLNHQGAFDRQAANVPTFFERQATFREYISYLNFVRVNLRSAEDGIDGFGREYDTALGARMIGTDAGHVTVDRQQVFSTLAELPAHDDLAIVLVKLEMSGTGGGGMAVIGGRSERTIIHEWGHAFGGLSDEYATHTHDRGQASTGINVSTTDDPKRVPWAHWIEARARRVGVYQGAAGQVRGAWKPTSSGCVMEDGEFFCVVCQEALVLAIYRYVDPIESCEPPPATRATKESLVLAEDVLELQVKVMQPASHGLEVHWYLMAPEDVPADPLPRGRAAARRAARGPLLPIDVEPLERTHPDRDGVHRFQLRARDLEPGRHRLICRARDTTRLRGERLPWVLEDPLGLLESERGWWIVVPQQ